MTLCAGKKPVRKNPIHRRRRDAEFRGGEQKNFSNYNLRHAFFASSNLRVSAPPVNLMVFNSATVSAC